MTFDLRQSDPSPRLDLGSGVTAVLTTPPALSGLVLCHPIGDSHVMPNGYACLHADHLCHGFVGFDGRPVELGPLNLTGAVVCAHCGFSGTISKGKWVSA